MLISYQEKLFSLKVKSCQILDLEHLKKKIFLTHIFLFYFIKVPDHIWCHIHFYSVVKSLCNDMVKSVMHKHPNCLRLFAFNCTSI